MVIRVEQGKGRKDRNVMLSPLLLPQRTVAESPYARAREGVTRKQHFAERLNLVEQDRSTLRERYRK